MRGIRIWPLAAVLVSCGGCAKEVVVTAEPLCAAVRNVCISRDDKLTEGTASQIEANNLARRRLCGKPPSCRTG